MSAAATAWSATNSARVRFPLSEETRRLLAEVREKKCRAYPAMFTGRMVRAILRGAKEQTSRERRWPISVGDLLWVRETWAPMCRVADPRCFCEDDAHHWIEYRADSNAPMPGEWPTDCADDAEAPRWRSAMLMPRYATRLLLRCMHAPYLRSLGDFDGDDVLREGCPIPADDPEGAASFDDVWSAINGYKASESDATVWIHRFEVLR